ncbi:MAG: adenylate/guanylate cyclase domain-containing protein, partial [Myxococcales bacterium]|nr:adenylate/guanylate cyclase domain-containing protein [Myxococcales bacterium]
DQMGPNAYLIYMPGTPQQKSYELHEQLVIGRRPSTPDEANSRVTVPDPLVSSRHCVVRRSSDGRIYVQDVSRNGTRLSGRRLVPNVEVEVEAGEIVQVGDTHIFQLYVETTEVPEELPKDETIAMRNTETEVTVLVGDIEGYTALNQHKGAKQVYESVQRVFAALQPVIEANKGTIKEYQGDAIFAFWEYNPNDPSWHYLSACRAAIELDNKTKELAQDSSIWEIDDHPLRLQWALTTGQVIISVMGGTRPTGMAMVGDAVNYAFRLEKFANDATGNILACARSSELTASGFEFRDLGEKQMDGREPEHVFSLVRSK